MKKNSGNVTGNDMRNKYLPGTSNANNSYNRMLQCLTKMVTDGKKYKEDGNAGLATSTLESAIDQFNSFLARWTSIGYTDYSRIMVCQMQR